MITLEKGEFVELLLTVDYNKISDSLNTEFLSAHTATTTTNFSDIEISSIRKSIQNNSEEFLVKIHASDTSLSGEYKVLIGIGNDEITISKFIDIKIES